MLADYQMDIINT